MRLATARVQNYWSVHDTGMFNVEDLKTILVGPNEAGKTSVLRALQTVKMPPGEEPDLDPLRAYPRSRLMEIEQGEVDPSDAPVATAVFSLDDDDRAVLSEHAPHLASATELEITRTYDGRRYSFVGCQHAATFESVHKPLALLRAHLVSQGEDAQAVVEAEATVTGKWPPTLRLAGATGKKLDEWLDSAVAHLDLEDDKIDKACDQVRAGARQDTKTAAAWNAIWPRVPFFVYFSQYFKVRPRIHLGRLAAQEEEGDIDEEYDFGNLCLLKLLGFTAAELSKLGRGVPDVEKDSRGNVVQPTDEEVEKYQDRLDKRNYRLNATSMTLTQAVAEVWGEERVLDIVVDGQYLKVVVINEDGARVELDQGSEGFRWLVSFYVVFQAQARGELKNAILLLDEPGLSLHALKQKQFRETVSKLAANNQTVFTTHSPFMVGTDELDLVRITEMRDRATGTVVHEDFAVDDPRSLFPLQAHLGYELGQTLFGQHRNLVVEGITDYWYLEAAADAANDAGAESLDDKVTIIPAGDAGKVVYHATVLHAQGLKMAALFDSDSAGEQSASQEAFVHLVKPKQILRVGDFYSGDVDHPEVEDLLRASSSR